MLQIEVGKKYRRRNGEVVTIEVDEVGKKYRKRNGDIVTIMLDDGVPGGAHPFLDNYGHWYTRYGTSILHDGALHTHDLVEEVVEEVVEESTSAAKGLHIEVGKKYRRRNGEVIEITHEDEDTLYPWKDDKGYWYCLDGQTNIGNRNYDLVEEVVEEFTDCPADTHREPAQDDAAKPKLVYIAGRYTGVTPDAVNLNCRAAEFMGLLARERGWYPVIPHMNTEAWDSDHNDNDADWYYENTLELLRRCDAVLMVPGWQQSTGARGEQAEALRLGKTVVYAAHELEQLHVSA